MAVKSISTTDLKYACLDADWRSQWIAGQAPQTAQQHTAGSISVFGTKFHLIVKKFIDWLIDKKNVKISNELKDKYSFWNEMYNRFAILEINRILSDNKIESAYYLCNALKAFCNQLAELRNSTSNFKLWNQIFLTTEFHVQDVPFDFDNNTIFVSGQLDCVRKHPVRGLEIVDYKLTRGENLKHDLIQLAIYSKLLIDLKPGVNFNGVIQYYTPELNEVVVTGDELMSLFNDIILPVLEEISVTRTDRSRIESKQDKQENIVDDLSVRIEQTFADFGLDIKIVERQEAAQLIRYKAKPSAGVKVISLINRRDDLQVALSLKTPPMIESSKGFVAIDIPKEKPDTFYWRNIDENVWSFNSNKLLSFPIGMSVDNVTVFGDFTDPNMCHALIAGSSGSGKSEFLKSLTASLIKNNTTDTLKLSIVDPKILTFGMLTKTNCPFLTEPVITDISRAISCLQSAEKEMETRYKQLLEKGFKDLNSYISSGRKDLPFHIIIFDEFADLILQGKKEKEEFERLVARLAAKGRAAGIHLVLATQRPDKDIVTGKIKANLPLKICMRVSSGINSKIVLDHSGAELLFGRGDLLCNRGDGIERAQSPYISQNEFLNLSRDNKNLLQANFKLNITLK